jgi:GT2 family glycosyltransferase
MSALQRLTAWRKKSTNADSLSDCSLIIPTYRRSREILELLTLLATLPDTPGEVVIVDGSPENIVEANIREWAVTDFRFDLVYVKSPAGLTRQRNVGLDACSREFIFFLDDDCLPLPGYFREIRQVFVDDKLKEVGAVRGFLTNGINKPLTRLWRLRFALGLVPRGEPGRYYPSGTSSTWDMVPQFSGVRRVDVLAGGASAYRREVFLKHRFSEFFYGYAQGEDLEMSLRIGKDWKLLSCGDALVNHNHAESGRPAGFARGKMAIRNRYFIWKRHSPNARAEDRLRFWGDHLLSVFYYLFGFVTRPWRTYFLGYAAGIVYGALACLVRPPIHDEPMAKKEYEFRLEDIFEETTRAFHPQKENAALLVET